METCNIKAVYGYLKQKIKKCEKDDWLFILEIIVLVVICILHSIPAGDYADFIPINGTFQNFNPVRRMLSGQVPYRDFQDYLGIGHLYIGTIATFLFGGNYRQSLMAFSFLTFVGLAVISLLIGLIIFKRKEIAVAVTNIVLIVLHIQPILYTNTFVGTSEFQAALNGAFAPGNSARFIRGFIMPLSCFLLWWAYQLYRRLAKKIPYLNAYREIICYVGIGMVAGFSFAWSNDYGISCWLCLTIMALWLSICRTRKFITTARNFIIEIVASSVSLFMTVEIFTVGHFVEWFRATFGTGGYQSWYYNSDKSYYLYDVDFSYIMIIQACFSLVYLIKLFKAKGTAEAVKRYGALAFINMASFCAVNEYKLLSGGTSREVALTTLFFTITYEIVALLIRQKDKQIYRKATILCSLIFSASWMIPTVKEEVITNYIEDKAGMYIGELGGNLTRLADDLVKTNEFLQNDRFFATYASAQEVVSNTFQPSGTDYIIHVLGDTQRENYLSEFKNGDFRYAATIQTTFDDWEYWIGRANWFFYRELYLGWHPVFANAYELYWERNVSQDANIVNSGFEINVVDVDDATKKIVIQCDSEINGTADVYIDYETEKKDIPSSKLLFQTMVRVENTGRTYASQKGEFFESNFLEPTSAEYIPVPVVNGYGEVTISSKPEKNTYFHLNECSCQQIYTVVADYLQFNQIETTEEGGAFVFSNASKSINALNGATRVEYNGVVADILEVTYTETDTYVKTNGKYDMETSNILHLMRN